MKKIIISTSLILVSFFLPAQEKLNVPFSKIDSLFSPWTNNEKPGITVAVLNDGKLEYQNSWGLANIEHNLPIESNTVFLFPEMSEQVLSFCMLLLEERNELSLNDPLTKYLDFVPSSFKQIKLKQLLHHTSAATDLKPLQRMSTWSKKDDLSQKAISTLLQCDYSIQNQGSESYRFNRSGLKFLQLVLEEVTQLSFKEFVEKEVFLPLGMTNSYIKSDRTPIANVARGYQANQGEFYPEYAKINSMICDPLYTTAKDILKWVDNFWRSKIGSPAIWKKMDRNVEENNVPVKTKNQSQFIGQHRYWDYRGLPKYYQIGMANGYAAKVVRYPSQDLAVVVLGNFSTYNGHLATICSSYYLENYFKENTSKGQNPAVKSLHASKLKAFEGSYWDYKDEALAQIELVDDTLRFSQAKYNWNTNILPIGNQEFVVEGRSTKLKFNPNKEGEELKLFLSNGPISFSKRKSMGKDLNNLEDYKGFYFLSELWSMLALDVKDNQLVLKNSDGLEVYFNASSRDEFVSNNSVYSRIIFLRDSKNKVNGLKVYNRDLKGIEYKISTHNNESI